MKPRALRTYKILAVAVAAAGCSSPTAPEAKAELPSQTASPPLAVQPGAAATPQPLDQVALMTLSAELSQLEPAKAFQRTAHFRPLCDKDGYPLVGNAMRKAPEREQTLPSQLCAEVRKQAAR
jgi:hypothetical protein